MKLITNEQKNRITEILKDEGYEVVGMDKLNNDIFIGIVPIGYKEVSKKLSEKIKKELGISTIINL